MKEVTKTVLREPVGRVMSKIAKMFQSKLQEDLQQLDIERSFHPLLLIEAGNGITQQELARILLVDKVQAVRIVDYLSTNGYVERVQNPADKRKYELTVTEKARQFIPDIKKVIDHTSDIAFNGLSENQIDELYNMLHVIENNLLSNKILSAK